MKTTVKDLEDLFTTAVTGPRRNISNLQAGEDIRFNRWEGQDPDGKRHQVNLPGNRKVAPWENYPDGRLFISDEVIATLTDISVVALTSAAVRVTPAHVSKSTADQSSELQAVVRWMVNGPLSSQWEDVAELAESTRLTHGCAVLGPRWEIITAMQYETVNAGQLTGESIPVAADMPEADTEPTNDPDAANEAETAGAMLEPLLAARYPDLKPGQVTKFARDIVRKGEARVPVERVVRNGPVIDVLRPIEDIVWPAETHVLKPHESRWVCRREWLTKDQLAARGRDHDWSGAWVESAQTKAQRMPSADNRTTGPLDDALVVLASEHEQRIELRYHYQWELNDDDVRELKCRVYVPTVPEFAEEYTVDAVTDDYPMVWLQSEVIHPQLGAARGVVDVMRTWEDQEKAIIDDANGRLKVTMNPPLVYRSNGYSDGNGSSGRRMTPGPQVGPGSAIDERLHGEVRLLPIAGGDAPLGLNMVQYFGRRTASYFGLPHPELPPILNQIRTQRRVSRTIKGWANALYQLAVLAYQNLTPVELESIIGRPPVLTAQELSSFRVAMKFNSATLDRDWILEMMGAVQQLMAVDRTGSLDSGKYVPLAMSFLDPVFGQEIASETAGASQKIYREVLSNVVSMQQGNEAEYIQNDATAPTKLQFLAQILGANLKYLAALAGDATRGMELLRQFPGSIDQYDPKEAPDPIFATRLVEYVKHLMFTAQQMGSNKEVGRLGVTPGQPTQS